MADSRLIQYYLGKVPDAEGRTISDILNFGLHDLEIVHDYIHYQFEVARFRGLRAGVPPGVGRDLPERGHSHRL